MTYDHTRRVRGLLDAMDTLLDDLTEDIACEVQTELRMRRGTE